MKYIFLFRRITDIDHIVPIIFGLIKRGINPKEILYTDQMIDKTVVNVIEDPRMKFICENDINFSQSKLINFYSIKNLENKRNFFLFKYFFKIILKIYFFLIQKFFFIKLLKILITSRNKIIITDEISNKNILKLSVLLKVKIISVPHGISFHNGDTKDGIYNFRYVLPDLHNYKNYKNIILYNNLLFDQDTNFFPNLKILGAPRYCREWNEIQSNFFPKINNLFENKKDNIFLILEKDHKQRYKDKYIDVIDPSNFNTLINFLLKNDNFNLIIKSHPSSKNNFQDLVKNKNLLFIDSDDKYKTFQLTKYVDVVLGFKSGAICDAILLNKYFLLLDFCHTFKLVASKFINKSNIALSFDDFKYKLENFKKHKEDNQKFIDEFLGDKNNQTLDNYYRYLIKL